MPKKVVNKPAVAEAATKPATLAEMSTENVYEELKFVIKLIKVCEEEIAEHDHNGRIPAVASAYDMRNAMVTLYEEDKAELLKREFALSEDELHLKF